ncbi:RpiB/LacA/LacB family sugar-phosphate isomerase [Patescibacteria group bacterium]|uniref:RpiB/LacA/LacB family sugar-phosphate isomerase n=1 Tax=candidate division WWE3 bacterium TaxID=2053526 RepID=A0A928TVH4_UNCKA|nr:RpiB/LacA/LacB family sugar-phosphate isomerase [candidate division WWE3 bacterium]MCL4733162.1 RpiB/LacA/LacB family sugar-phosphate isomerase [Patescibacteria group bacterium]MDL1953372.1 RpiB/LacA/LacB family sugar-phosphate isomerase [Candidatus Uhrbacteria bacterium UHB]RIL00740.1 MAG: ribose-5-phosphate isomerase [Candidatus Uhrbacteria bacterium]
MKNPTIYIGADHAGFTLKEKLLPLLRKHGYDVQDMTPGFMEGDDYPPIGKTLARRIAGSKSKGILVCGSGVGVAIAANRIKGARAVEAHSEHQVKKAREHNDVNILTLGGWNTTPAKALSLIRTFMQTPFSSAERHRRRVKQLG